MVKVRIRGVYSTALTKLFLDEGFEIVQPSITIKERFELKDNNESPDLDIDDRGDLQGVRAQGKKETIRTLKFLLQSRLDDVIIRGEAVTVNGVYKGLIKSVNSIKHTVFIDIGPTVGKMAENEISDTNQKQVVVQVEGVLGAKAPLLTTRIRIPGKYAVLLADQGVNISRKIRDTQKQSRLLQLGKELATPKWGILWRTASEDQSLSALKDEIANLVKGGEAVLRKAADVEAPAMILEGDHFADVEFPYMSKKILDDVRESVTPTLGGHHYYKACGGTFSSALDMAERLLEKGHTKNEVKELFRRTIEAEYADVESIIDIYHVKLDGKVVHLGRALMEAYNEEEGEIQLRRNFEKEGIYDGLGVKKEQGDYAITKAKVGDWHVETQYFARDEQYKGTYININTPIELYPYGIRYVDLEVDVCIWPNGELRTLDKEKLEKAASEGIVTEKLVGIVKEKLQEIMRNLS